MTQVYDDKGNMAPVTVLQLGPCPVLQVRTPERDGYHAVQVGFLDKPRRKAIRAERGHVAADFSSKRRKGLQEAGVQVLEKANVEPQRHIREFRLDKGVGFITKAECSPAEAKLTVERIRPGKDATQPFEAYAEELTLKVGQVLKVRP